MADQTCTICGKTFSTGQELDRHYGDQHPGAPRFQSVVAGHGSHGAGMAGGATGTGTNFGAAGGGGATGTGGTGVVRDRGTAQEPIERELGERLGTEAPARFRCEICGAEFATSQELGRHTQAEHRGQRRAA